jgi:hypothetical protein
MAHDHHYIEVKTEQVIIAPKLFTLAYILIAIGAVSLASTFMMGHGEHNPKPWAAMLVGAYYTMGLGMAGAIFVCLARLTAAGWSVGMVRIAEAMMQYIPVGGIVLLAVTFFGMHDIYHWSHEGITDPKSEHFDPIIESKSWFLNIGMFFGIQIVSYLAWTLFTRKIRSNSINEDEKGGLKALKQNKTLASIFVVFYGVSWAMFSWAVIMSIDPHWYSTIFWVYQFVTTWLTGLSFIAIVTVLLKRAGYLSILNDNHFHDLGKLMFGFSVFWAYIWVSQFLLIYYANIPDEAIYFDERFGTHWKPYFFFNLIINFVTPFLFLMTRGAKRKNNTMLAAGIILMIGHWSDIYLEIMPGIQGSHATLLPEFGATLLFLGLFLIVFFKSLSKASLVPAKHPYAKEFAYHNI